MNFLLHRALAARDHQSSRDSDGETAELAGLGAMLPDVWRMAHRRLRALRGRHDASDEPGLATLLFGVEHHLRADGWFHRHPAFTEGEARLGERLRRIDVLHLSLFAHIGWELCLDGALLRRDGVDTHLEPLRRGLAAARHDDRLGAALRHHEDGALHELGDGVLEATAQRVDDVLEHIAEGSWPAGYADAEALLVRLDGVRRRIGLDPVPAGPRDAVVDLFAEALDAAPPYLEELLGVTTSLD